MTHDGTTPCIWMSAGLVAYKLCDRDLDCDHCPFDDAMRGAPQPPATPDRRPGVWVFPDDRVYHGSHVWVCRAGSEPSRIGLDAFAARAAGEVTAVILPEEGTHLRPGEVAGWIVDRSVAVPFESPVEGTVSRRNPALTSSPSLVVSAPYHEGWLVEVRERAPADDGGLLTAREVGELAEVQLAGLHEQSRKDAAGETPSVGATLPDGGDLLGDLRRNLGARRFHRLLGRLPAKRTSGRKRTR